MDIAVLVTMMGKSKIKFQYQIPNLFFIQVDLNPYLKPQISNPMSSTDLKSFWPKSYMSNLQISKLHKHKISIIMNT